MEENEEKQSKCMLSIELYYFSYIDCVRASKLFIKVFSYSTQIHIV